MCNSYIAVTANDHGEKVMADQWNQSSYLSLEHRSAAMGNSRPLHSNDYDYKELSNLSSSPDDVRGIWPESRDSSARSVGFERNLPGTNGSCNYNSQEVTDCTKHTENLEVDQNEAMRLAATRYRRRSSTSRPSRRLAMGRTSSCLSNRLVNSISYHQI